MKNNKNRIVTVFLLIVPLLMLLNSCASDAHRVKPGMDYYKVGEYDKAVEYFEGMVEKFPANQELRAMLFRAKLNSYYHHLGLARKLRTAPDKKEEAVSEYKISLGVFPDNKRLQQELDEFLGIVPKDKLKTFQSKIVPPVSLNVDSREQISLKLRSVPITKIFKMLGKSYNVNFIFDKDFRDFVYTLEIENIGFYDILKQLCMISNTKSRIIDPSSVLIYPNTTFKNRTFALRGIKVFYLSNIKAEDAKKLIMAVFREEQIMVQDDTTLNSLIVKADNKTLHSIEKFLAKIDKEKSEIEVDIEIIEVNRNLLNRIGMTFGSTLLSFAAGGDGGTDGQVNATMEVGDLKNTNFYVTLPSTALNLLASDDNSKIIAKPNLRGVNNEDIKFMVGDEVPIPQTQFQPIAAGGTPTQPMTTYQYKNVGVEIKITPFIHENDEVTLKMKLTMNFLSGYVDNFPTFGKRELENVIRLKAGETNIIGGFIKDEHRTALGGLPALSRIPVLGRLFGSTEKTVKQTDLIFSITPRVVRRTDLSEFDVSTIWSSAEDSTSGGNSGGKIVEPSRELKDEPPDRQRPGTMVTVSPSRRKIPVNQSTVFSIRLSARESLSSLSVGGSIGGGSVEIEDLKTDFIKEDQAKVLKNYSGNSFDLGYSFSGKSPNNILGQLKLKFTEKGNYTIEFTSVNAYAKDRQQVEVKTNKAEIEVF